MKIAQLAPPWITVPPAGYGGIEWVVAELCNGLVDRGHDVTLFASAGSDTKANLVSTFDPAPGAARIGETYLDVVHTFSAYERADEFDLIHDHSGFVGLALATRCARPVVHTVHGPLNAEELRWYDMVSGRVHLVAISDSQAAPAPHLSWAGRVYNGIDLRRYPFRADKEDFLLFVGRVNAEKGPEIAVEVAARTGMRLVMAVKDAEAYEKRYWAEMVEPRLTGREEILGEITVEEKADLMSRARAVLFPITWPEPFGLVMTEAMATGTPVIAFPRGAAVEVIADGQTGFLVDDAVAMCDAVARAADIDPTACRAHVERGFSAEAMVAGYEDVFERVLAAAPPRG